jgi:RecA/RadA recombinase
VRSPLLTTKEAAEYIKMSEQYLIQGRNNGTAGNGTPPPNCIEIYGERGDGKRAIIRYEVAECNHWIAAAPRRFSDESQERRRKEYAA